MRRARIGKVLWLYARGPGLCGGLLSVVSISAEFGEMVKLSDYKIVVASIDEGGWAYPAESERKVIFMVH